MWRTLISDGRSLTRFTPAASRLTPSSAQSFFFLPKPVVRACQKDSSSVSRSGLALIKEAAMMLRG